PCQLPPVGQAYSPALDMDWLARERRSAIAFTLETIEKTKADNDILLLATRVRHMVNQESLPKWPKLPAKGRDNVKLYPDWESLFKGYLEKFKKVGPNGVLAIVRSNLSAQAINGAFRKELYGSAEIPVRVDDILLINRNNYKVPLTNGDFVTVSQIG